MTFKTLIVVILILITVQTLRHNHHLTTTTAECVSPGSFNASTGQCDCKNGSVADTTTKKCVCPK